MAQRILRQQFPDIGGLMCPSFSVAADYPKITATKWMQILHNPDHWELVAHGMLESRRVTVYDSFQFDPKIRQQVLACMSWLTRTAEPTMNFQMSPCMRQSIA